MGLSQFLLFSCTLDKFVMTVAPGHPHLYAIKIMHRDNFLAKVPGLCPVLSSSNAYEIIPPGRWHKYLTTRPLHHCAVLIIFRLDKLVKVHIPGFAPRTTDNQPARHHLPGSVNIIPLVSFTGTLPSHDGQMLVLTCNSISRLLKP
jgi:hypothetical protein